MEESRVLFSIIVPVYQVENYIGQCIESLLLQCQENSEIIIVDDKIEKVCKMVKCKNYIDVFWMTRDNK